MTKAPILRSTPADWKATGVIAVLCAIAVGGAAITANINQAHLSQAAVPGDKDAPALADVPGIATAGAWADGVGVPAVIAGYALVYGITKNTIDSAVLLNLLGGIAGLVIGVSAIINLNALGESVFSR